MQKTIKEIVEETVAFYEEDPSRRAIRGKGYFCEYLTLDRKMCAVGRCMHEGADPASLVGDVSCLARELPDKETRRIDDLDSLLQPEYRGHRKEFWRELQGWHDSFRYWDASLGGSAEDRRRVADRIIADFSS